MRIKVYPKRSDPFVTKFDGDKDNLMEAWSTENCILVGEEVALLCSEITRVDFLKDEVDGEEE